MQSDVRPLRDLCSLIADCPHSTPVWTDSGFIVIRNQNIKNGRLDLSTPSYTDAENFAYRTRRAKPVTGDIIFTREAPMGEVCLVPKGLECCVGQRQVLLRPNPAVADGRFLLYALQSPQVQHEIGWSEGTGSTVSNVRIPVLEALRIPFPPLAVQQEVGKILGGLDDRIDLLRQTNTTLESIAHALFKSWFIDFDPVRAKVEGREPEGMDAATAALFPSEFEESALGMIPKGWRASTLGSLCELTKGCSYKGDGLSEAEGAFMFNLGCFNAQRVFATEKVKRYTGEYRPRHAVSPGDLIIANTDMTQARDILGRPVLVPDGFEPGFVSHHVFKVTVLPFGGHKPEALRNFLFFTFREPTFRERAIGFATGTTVLALPASAVTDCPAYIPDAASLIEWNNVVQSLFDAIGLNEARAEQLASLRDTLLPRLISGKLRLPEAQDQLEDALA
jgi:type I restriction enzyme S subunit